MSRKGGTYWLFNDTPSRVKLTPDEIIEEYAVSPPPFVNNSQTITISNIPKTMNEFDSMTEKFAGVNGGTRLARPVVTPLPVPVNPKGGGITPAVPVKPAITPTAPPTSGGGGGGVGGGAPKAETDTGAGSGGGIVAKVGFADDLKSHWLAYAIGVIGGGATGYYIGNKYKEKSKWLGVVGAVAGAGIIFGIEWLYFNKMSGEASKTSAPETPPAVSEKPDDK